MAAHHEPIDSGRGSDLFGTVDLDADDIGWLTAGVDIDPYGLPLADDQGDWLGPFHWDENDRPGR